MPFMTVVRDTPAASAAWDTPPHPWLRMGTVKEGTLPLRQVRRDSSEDLGQMGVRDHAPPLCQP